MPWRSARRSRSWPLWGSWFHWGSWSDWGSRLHWGSRSYWRSWVSWWHWRSSFHWRSGFHWGSGFDWGSGLYRWSRSYWGSLSWSRLIPMPFHFSPSLVQDFSSQIYEIKFAFWFFDVFINFRFSKNSTKFYFIL